MGSRAVVVVCRDEDAARARFGVEGEGIGVCVTRTGRRFFDDMALEVQFLAVVRDALTGSGLWDELGTDWVCLDCELLPWSAKAQALLRDQYAAVGAAATAALPHVVAALHQASAHTPGLEPLLEKFAARETTAGLFVDAYRRYCWPVHSLADLKLAPFHLLASEGGVHTDRDHGWHMATLARLCMADTSGLLRATPHRTVDVTDPESVAGGIRWWEKLTAKGGEGMVVKPWNFITRGATRPGPARRQVPGPRVPADHLRPGLRRPREPVPPARSRPVRQAVTSRARVRLRDRGAGAVRPP